jgi:hypothetical protein
MAHKVMDGGTTFEIAGGRLMDAGSVYEVSKGKFMDGGTVYEIGFSNLPPVGAPLNDLTWEQIRAISDAGLAADYFSVGDTKTITINGTFGSTTFSNLSIDAFIIGIDHNSSVEGSNKIHFQVGKINSVDVCFCASNYGYFSGQILADGFVMNKDNINTGGWASSYMRTTILGSDSDPTTPKANTLLAALPSELRAVMKPVTKYSDNKGDGTNTAAGVTATTDYLWLLAAYELGSNLGASPNKVEANYQAQYDYYASGNSRTKYKHNATSTSAYWWTRSVWGQYSSKFLVVYSDGSVWEKNSYLSQGMSPAFAV